MRILVTGADGFIGRRLIAKLQKIGHEVFCFDIEDGDISLKNCLDKFKDIEHIYHLAARTFVPDSWDKTYDYFQTNIMGTVTVLEYCRYNKCNLTIMSTYVYGEPEYLPIDERHPIKAVSPYHESKIIDEDLCRFYSEKFGVAISILRPFNVYGRGQNESFLVPKIFSQVMDNSFSEIAVMDLNPRRDYIYIDDVIEALICTLRKTQGCDEYNIGSGISLSVEDVIKIIMDVSGIQKPYISTKKTRTNEVSDCVANIDKAIYELGFKCKYTFSEGISKWI